MVGAPGDPDPLRRLAELIRRKNRIDAEMAEIIQWPAHVGHVAEFIAARIFGIELVNQANQKAIDGRFVGGYSRLNGRSVNVKYKAWNDHQLNVAAVNAEIQADYYLVLTGPPRPPGPAKNLHSPFVFCSVFLFESVALRAKLAALGKKGGDSVSGVGGRVGRGRNLSDPAEQALDPEGRTTSNA